jgi:hypothetical protein
MRCFTNHSVSGFVVYAGIERARQRIEEHLAGLLESDAVLGEV